MTAGDHPLRRRTRHEWHADGGRHVSGTSTRRHQVVAIEPPQGEGRGPAQPRRRLHPAVFGAGGAHCSIASVVRRVSRSSGPSGDRVRRARRPVRRCCARRRRRSPPTSMAARRSCSSLPARRGSTSPPGHIPTISRRPLPRPTPRSTSEPTVRTAVSTDRRVAAPYRDLVGRTCRAALGGSNGSSGATRWAHHLLCCDASPCSAWPRPALDRRVRRDDRVPRARRSARPLGGAGRHGRSSGTRLCWRPCRHRPLCRGFMTFVSPRSALSAAALGSPCDGFWIRPTGG